MERVVAAEVTGPYRLHLTFSDGVSGEVDLKPDLKFKGIFEPLRDPSFFAQISIDGGTVVWPNEADLAPEFLYDLVVGHCVHEWAEKPDADAPSQ